MELRFGRYGPSPRYGLPPGGLCLSSFAIVRRRGAVLIGMPAMHARWVNEWAPNYSTYKKEDLEREFQSWRFPSAYLIEGERPDQAVDRVMKDQLQVTEYSCGPMKLLNFYDPSSWFPGERHWDFCFLYEVRTKQEMDTPAWFKELRFVPVDLLGGFPFGSAQGDLIPHFRSIAAERAKRR